MAWVSRTAVFTAALVLVATRGAAGYSYYSYEPGERSDPWDQRSSAPDPRWLVDPRTGCMAYDSNAGQSDSISWSGECPFGRADGHGTLTFYDNGRIFEQLTGNFDAGTLEDGRVSITWADGSHYDGQERNGQFNGYGVLTNADGTRYEGQWRNDKFVSGTNYGTPNDEVAGGSGSESQGGNDQQPGGPPGAEGDANHSAQSGSSNGLPPAGDMPFKMSTAPSKSPQIASKPQAPNAAKPQPPAQVAAKQPSAPAIASAPAKWAFLIGKHPRLVAADGSKLELSVANGALARALKRPDGSIAKDSLVFVSETSGAVRNEKGDAVATFQLANHGVAIDYSDGSSETVSPDRTGLVSVAEMRGEASIETRWYPEGHKFSHAERKHALKQLALRLAAQRRAAAKAREAKPEARVAAQTPAQHPAKPEMRVAQAAPAADPPSPIVRSAIRPMLKPESIAAATDLPTPGFKPGLRIASHLTRKRNVEPPVQVAAAEPQSAPATAIHKRHEHDASARDENAPARVAQAEPEKPSPAPAPERVAEATAPHASAREPAAHPTKHASLSAKANDTPTARASSEHPSVVREADATTATEQQKRSATVAQQPPAAAQPAPQASHVASLTPPAKPARVTASAPEPHAPLALITPSPAVRVASAAQSAAAASHAAAPAPNSSRAGAPVVHAAAPSSQPATRVATAAAPATHVETASPSNAHAAPAVPLAPAVAHAATTPLPVQAVAHLAAPPAPMPAVEHLTTAPPTAAPAAHVAAALPPPAHTLLPQTSPPASRRGGSECLSIVSNGTHWGFRNNCENDIQFAYCIMNGTDRLTACGDSAVPGSVAAHGFTSLVADLSVKDGGANRSFRWVGCNGGAGEVVPRLDRADPPMGRCLHASDLPQGTERADVGKKLAK